MGVAVVDDTREDGFSGLPGNLMMWILIFSELAVFGAALVGFAVARTLDPVTFDAGQAHLDRLLGGLNTLVLVTSGYVAALGVEAGRHGLGGRARRLFCGAAAVGCVFLVIKMMEYSATLSAGYTIDSDAFFGLYFMLTGFHALHVVFGIGLLLVVAWKNSVENLETGAAFWHMVDLIWVILYPIVYLIR